MRAEPVFRLRKMVVGVKYIGSASKFDYRYAIVKRQTRLGHKSPFEIPLIWTECQRDRREKEPPSAGKWNDVSSNRGRLTWAGVRRPVSSQQA